MAYPPLPIPLPELEKLVPPDLSRAYFDHGADFPFEPDASAYSLRNAWWLAECAFAAYAAPSDAINFDGLHRADWDFDRISGESTQCLRFESSTAIILAFRGTRIEGFNDPLCGGKFYATNWRDVVTDLTFISQDIGGGRSVHKGFDQALDPVFGRIEAAAGKATASQKKIWCTGHSLGAALATLAADRLSKYRVQGLYTYGSPRVGNNVFVNSFPVSNTHRFVHHCDVITTVPPEGIYVHVGRLRYITADARILETVEKGDLLTSLREGLGFVRELVDVTTKDFDLGRRGTWPIASERIADHAPIYYANKIWNELIRSV